MPRIEAGQSNLLRNFERDVKNFDISDGDIAILHADSSVELQIGSSTTFSDQQSSGKFASAHDEWELQNMDMRDDGGTSSSRSGKRIDCRDDGSASLDMNLNNMSENKRCHAESKSWEVNSSSSSLHSFCMNESLSPITGSGSISRPARYCSESSISTGSGSILRPARYSSERSIRTTTSMADEAKSQVYFSTLEIREYPITLGNNPGGVQGPPICLDWKHKEERTVFVSLDEYEGKREPRRSENDLYIPECLRRWKLLEQGVSMRRMQKASKEADNVRKQRRKTIQIVTGKTPPTALDELKCMVKQLVG